MRRSRKIIKYLAATIGVIILVAIIFSKVIFSSDRLTALVLPKISQLLNREVSAEQVELSFFPTIGVKIIGLEVSNPSSGKYNSPYLLEAKSVVIDAKILPLLKNRLVINNVIFYSPTIYLERNSRGRLNTHRLMNESFYGDRGEVRGSLSSLLLSNFEVSNGTFVWDDDKDDVSLKFLDVDFTSRIKTVVEEDRLLLSSRLKVDRFEFNKGGSDLFQGDDIDLSADLEYDKQHDLVKIRSEKGSIFGIQLKSAITYSFYPTTALKISTVNIDSSAKGIYNVLPAFMKNVVLRKSITGKLGLSFGLTKRGSGTDMKFRIMLNDFKADLRSGDSLRIRNLEWRYEIDGDSASYSLSMPRATLGQNFASVNLAVSPPMKASARITADVDLQKLARNLDMPREDKFSGSVRAKYNFNYDARSRQVRANGLLTFANALVRMPVGIDTLYTGECDGSVLIRNNRATFNKLLVRLGASDMIITGSLSDYQAAFVGNRTTMPSLKLRIVSKTFNTIGLLPHMNLNVGRPLLAWLPTANISLNFTAGRFLMPTDSLSNLSANLQLLDYFVKLRNLNYTSSIGSFSVSGWTDYSQENRTTFSVRTRLSTSDFGRLLRRYLGRDEIHGGSGKGSLTINGVLNDRGQMDLASLGGRGHMELSNVSIRRYSVLTKLFSFLGAPGRDSAKFKNAAFTVDITDGRVYFNRLVAYGEPLDFRLDGWHGFDGTLDYKLALRVYPPLSVEMSSYLGKTYPDLNLGPDNSLKLGVVAGGTTNDARFTIVSFNGSIAQESNSIRNSFLAAR